MGDIFQQKREELHRTTAPLLNEWSYTGTYTYLTDIAEKIEKDFSFDAQCKRANELRSRKNVE